MTENRGNFTLEAAQSFLAVEPEMVTEKLFDNLWTVTDGVVRTIFLEGHEGVVAFDTFGTPGRARAYKKAIEAAIPGKEIKHIIYTHDHLDHAGFAADLEPEANIIADEMCARVIKIRQAEGQLTPSQILMGKENHLSVDGVEMVLLNPGPTHGSGNLSAYFEREKLLFSSDTILANAKYGFMPDYHFANFVIFMRTFLQRDWNKFIPGRYEMTDRAGFERGCDFIESVQIECQNAFAEFVPIWAYEPMKGYLTGKLKESYGDLDGFDDHIGQIAIRVVHHYLMGGWGLEDTPAAGVLLADSVEI